ncbi:histidine phosphatase family protein [Streptomyces profundus]|uniref:histidine phosphatase family protein n=1 Tax=Streptomyces profundus TaxID=2867410 RepID=UPI001D166C37|nr:histidine phosphatase family protein [Streptomyces sp. MA3_2.13]UED86687.1 histidine phosphatase family protein [Streptomyces sp. MA3_2.13]
MGDGVLPGRFRLAELVAVRHGESVSNVVFAEAAREGRADERLAYRDAAVELTPRGVAQAEALGARLAGWPAQRRPEWVLCSPYTRARQTWDVVARGLDAPPPVVVDERLRDREMGVFELLTPLAIERRAPEEAARRAKVGEWFYRPPGGESFADVTLRVRDLLREVSEAVPGSRVLVVAHDAVVVALARAVAGLGVEPRPEARPVPNASLTRWTGDGTRLRLAEFGDAAHLA